jgi:predicted RNase H-like HicB family nuclease
MKIDVSRLEPTDNYRVNVAWSPEDDAFIATIPELPGCIADGKTRLEAIAHLADAQACWIEACLEGKLNVPSPNHYAPPSVPAMQLKDLELALLRKVAAGEDIRSSDRSWDRAKTRLKKAGYIEFDRDYWRWGITEAGRMGLRRYVETKL